MNEIAKIKLEMNATVMATELVSKLHDAKLVTVEGFRPAVDMLKDHFVNVTIEHLKLAGPKLSTNLLLKVG